MKENAVKLFFQYKKGTISSYSETTLTNAAYYLPELHKFLEKKNRSLIYLLEDLPLHLFAYYTDYLFTFEGFEFLQKIPSIENRMFFLQNDESTEKIYQDINRSSFVFTTRKIGANAILVSIPKREMKYNYTYDYLIHINQKGIKGIELLSEYRLIHYKKDELYERNKNLLEKSLYELEQKNKLRLFFVS